MLLFVFASLRVLVLEDEVNLLSSVSLDLFSCDARHTLFVVPHLSGPNMITYGEALENSSEASFLSFLSSFMYAPPHSRPFCNLTSY